MSVSAVLSVPSDNVLNSSCVFQVETLSSLDAEPPAGKTPSRVAVEKEAGRHTPLPCQVQAEGIPLAESPEEAQASAVKECVGRGRLCD